MLLLIHTFFYPLSLSLSLADAVRQENERSMRENLERTLMMKNLTELNLQRQQQLLNQVQPHRSPH